MAVIKLWPPPHVIDPVIIYLITTLLQVLVTYCDRNVSVEIVYILFIITVHPLLNKITPLCPCLFYPNFNLLFTFQISWNN